MANKFYPKGKEKMLLAQVNWAADTIKVVLVTSAYTYSDAHEFLSDLSTVGTAQTLANKTTTNGVFDADDVAFTALATGSTVKALAIYKDTGVASTSPLLAYLDGVTGFPMATSGADALIPWSAGPAKIFTL